MRLYQILAEAHVNSTIVDANQLIGSSVVELVKQLYRDLGAARVIDNTDAVDAFMKKVRAELEKRKDKWTIDVSKALSSLIIREIEGKYGKITRYGDQQEGPAKWESLWWVNEPIVWIREQDRDTRTYASYGYFQYDGNQVVEDFPEELTFHLDPRKDIAVGIAIFSPITKLFASIYDEIFENIVGSNHVGFVLSERIQEIIHGMVSTFSHEVKHLYHYISQNLATASKHIRDSRGLFAQANFLPKKKRVHHTQLDDIFSGFDVPTYLMTATEVDAHATSVASKLILRSASTHPQYEIEALEDALLDLSYGFAHSDSYDRYRSEIRAHGKQFDRVWKRFLKKIASEVTARIEELKTKRS